MDMPENTLKPCPFCGGEAELQVEELDINSLLGCVVCMECYATGAEKDNWNDAITSWNTRSDIAWNEALEAAIREADEKENYWNTVAYDKRQAGKNDSFACASASAYAHMGQALRAMKREPK